MDTANLKVFCDENADLQLFNKIKELSSNLKQISKEQISIYPSAPAAKKRPIYKNLVPLFQYDRPDYIITYSDEPILVVEITEHAYTGDNGLQRFGRVASAAENGVAFIYFGPISRVRDDELDLTDDPTTLSKRSLTSDFYEGMAKLNETYGTLQLFSEWEVGANGKVTKVPLHASKSDFSDIYGNLISLIESVLNHETDKLKSNFDKDNYKIIEIAESKLNALCENTNTKFTDVKKKLNRKQTIDLINNPKKIIEHVGDGYFYKGKPDKLLAYFSLNKYKTSNMIISGKLIQDQPEIDKFINQFCSLKIFLNGSYVYYSGYKWRSDPHCGVAINMYYRRCCDEPKIPLILFYPRISILKSNTDKLISDIQNTNDLLNLFIKRYSLLDGKAKYRKTISSKTLFHYWGNKTKQSRIFKKYCSLIFCNDGIIAGKPVEELLI